MTAYATVDDIRGPGESFSPPCGFSDDDIEAVIADIEDEIEEYTDQDFSGASSQTLSFDGSGDRLLFTQPKIKLPIVSISSITWREDASYSFSSSNAWESSDFNANKWYIEATGSDSTVRGGTRIYFTKGIVNYQVVGTFGYSSVPKPIKMITVMMARDRISPGYLNQQNITMEGWEDYRMTVSTTKRQITPITGFPSIDSILTKYRMRAPLLLKV